MNDTFLDEIARTMTDVDAPASLRARVLSEIGRPRPLQFPFRLRSIVAAGAMAALAVVALRPVLQVPELPTVSRPPIARVADGIPVPLSASVDRIAFETPAQVISADELAWLARAVPPLQTPPVLVDAIQPVGLSIAPINVEPLTVEPISLPPVNRGVERQ